MGALSAPADFVQPFHLVVLGHPDPDSFAGTVARTYCETVLGLGQQAVLRDLYAIGFDPRLGARERPGAGAFVPAADIAEDIALLRRADVITLVYPIWFGMPPAIIKGYIDRVLGAGFSATAIKDGEPHPLLAGKRLALFTSSASTRPWLEEKGQWSALRQAFEIYLQNIFGLVGAGHTHFDAIVSGLKPGLVEECQAEVRAKVREISAQLLSERRKRQSIEIRHQAGRRSPLGSRV